MVGLGENEWKQLLTSCSMDEVHAKYEFYSMKTESSLAGDTDDLHEVTRDSEEAYYDVGKRLVGRIPSHRERKRPWDPQSSDALNCVYFQKIS